MHLIRSGVHLIISEVYLLRSGVYLSRSEAHLIESGVYLIWSRVHLIGSGVNLIRSGEHWIRSGVHLITSGVRRGIMALCILEISTMIGNKIHSLILTRTTSLTFNPNLNSNHYANPSTTLSIIILIITALNIPSTKYAEGLDPLEHLIKVRSTSDQNRVHLIMFEGVYLIRLLCI